MRPNGSRRPKPRPASDPLVDLLLAAQALPGNWRTSACTIATPAIRVRTAGRAWHVQFHVYGTRLLLTRASKVEFVSSVSISEAQSGRRSTPSIAQNGWCAEVTSRLRALGYRGEWSQSPEGSFAHFSKPLRSALVIPKAVAELQRLEW